MLRLVIFLVMIIFTILISLTANAAVPAALVCPKVEQAPMLDGHLDDWPPLPQLVITGSEDWRPSSTGFADYGGPTDVSAEVRLAWDNQALYLAIQTMDDRTVRVRSAAEIDRGDSLVLGLAGEEAEQVNQFVVALLRGASLVWRAEPSASAGEVRTIGRAMAVTEQEQGGVTIVYELAMPWSELKQIRPLPGAQFTASVSVCDDDGAGLEGCLERSVEVVLSSTGLGPVSARPTIARPPSVSPSFPAPGIARFDERSFILNDKATLLIGGEVDYTRLPQAVWDDRLARLKAAGLNTVGVTVPWAYHQPTPAPADLSELRGFLDLCKAKGLWVQLNLGPFVGEKWESGGAPGWVVAQDSPREIAAATDKWLAQLLATLIDYQITTGGPIVYVVVRPLPNDKGEVTAATLERAYAAIRSAGITVPVVTANSPAARSIASQALTGLLDTLNFYESVAPEALVKNLASLSVEEVGPTVITGLAGDYRSAESARRSLDRMRFALANGAAAVILSDFAPGFDATTVREPGDWTGKGVIDPAGALSSGYGELKLLGALASSFGSELVSAASSEEMVEVDDPEVRGVVRYGKEQAFLFISDVEGKKPHQIRLSYLELDRATPINVPEAGAIQLPAGGIRMLPLAIPFGRGLVRYSTSEVLSVGQVGERSLLVVYGDIDTPGEIALRLPGPPLVSGNVVRQRWEEESKTIFLDYYHEAKDKYLLIDELVIAVVSRERAATALSTAGEMASTAVIANANIAAALLQNDSLKARLDCPAGLTEATVALPRAPSAVLLDGKPLEFSFTTPERVLRFSFDTKPFAEEQKAASVWQQLGRAIVGGPPRIYVRYDRGMFMPDPLDFTNECGAFKSIFGAPEKAGLRTGSFARLRARFAVQGMAELVMSGSRYPALVFVNGQFVSALSAGSLLPRADITPYVTAGENELEIIVQVLPRSLGVAGLNEENDRLPEVRIVTEVGAPALTDWQVCRGLAGEADDFAADELDTTRWHFIRFGPWRERGRDLENVRGPGWYRVTFDLPRASGWRIPYYAQLDLRGAGKLYAGGRPVASLAGDGKYLLPLSSPPLSPGAKNTLAAVLYGSSPQIGLYELLVAADESKMTRQRILEIKF